MGSIIPDTSRFSGIFRRMGIAGLEPGGHMSLFSSVFRIPFRTSLSNIWNRITVAELGHHRKESRTKNGPPRKHPFPTCQLATHHQAEFIVGKSCLGKNSQRFGYFLTWVTLLKFPVFGFLSWEIPVDVTHVVTHSFHGACYAWCLSYWVDRICNLCPQFYPTRWTMFVTLSM